MFCQYQYYRYYTEKLQAAVNHSDESYNCEEMSACPYTGTTIINKIPWGDWPADSDSDSSSQHSSATESEAGETQEEDQTEESDTN